MAYIAFGLFLDAPLHVQLHQRKLLLHLLLHFLELAVEGQRSIPVVLDRLILSSLLKLLHRVLSELLSLLSQAGDFHLKSLDRQFGVVIEQVADSESAVFASSYSFDDALKRTNLLSDSNAVSTKDCLCGSEHLMGFVGLIVHLLYRGHNAIKDVRNIPHLCLEVQHEAQILELKPLLLFCQLLVILLCFFKGLLKANNIEVE